jgi:hypothetical protein
MKLRGARPVLTALTLVVAAGGIGTATASGAVAAPTGGATVWIQTMDSCKQSLGSAGYTLTGGGVSMSADTPASSPSRVASTGVCPLQQGSCAGGGRGCASFTSVPPGTYTVRTTRTPPATTSNPEGYAPCEGGSACRSEVANVIVAADGSVQATVTNVYPDGTTVTWPTSGSSRRHRAAYAATTADPVVIHDFGLAPPGSSNQCDGDSDADDHLTGTPSAHCAYPESQEDAACKPYPWSCTVAPADGRRSTSAGA